MIDGSEPVANEFVALCAMAGGRWWSEWAVQRARYVTLETIAPLSEDTFFELPAVAA
jgi:hypothetical protein